MIAKGNYKIKHICQALTELDLTRKVLEAKLKRYKNRIGIVETALKRRNNQIRIDAKFKDTLKYKYPDIYDKIVEDVKK
jgi:hypothetical protein